MKTERLQEIANKIRLGENLPIPLHRGDRVFQMTWGGKVYGKERPRFAQGHAYTPKETRDFEASVRDTARKVVQRDGIPIFRTSVEVKLVFYDKVPDNWPKWMKILANYGYVISHGGADLDNKEKAILDALNAVVYEDDRQVVKLFKERLYSTKMWGFYIEVTPCGLSKVELDTLKKMLAGWDR